MILIPFSFVVKLNLKVKVDAQSVLLKLADQLIMNSNYLYISSQLRHFVIL